MNSLEQASRKSSEAQSWDIKHKEDGRRRNPTLLVRIFLGPSPCSGPAQQEPWPNRSPETVSHPLNGEWGVRLDLDFYELALVHILKCRDPRHPRENIFGPIESLVSRVVMGPHRYTYRHEETSISCSVQRPVQDEKRRNRTGIRPDKPRITSLVRSTCRRRVVHEMS